MIQDQTNRKDAGKPLYHLLPTEYFEEKNGIPFDSFLTRDDLEAADFNEEIAALVRFWRREATRDDLFLPGNLDEINGVCAVLKFGMEKYSANGWEKQPLTYSRVYRSALAHAIKHATGANGGLDEETGLPHIDHFRCNVLFLWTYDRRGLTQLDDRPTGIVRGQSEAESEIESEMQDCLDEGLNVDGSVKIEVGREPV